MTRHHARDAKNNGYRASRKGYSSPNSVTPYQIALKPSETTQGNTAPVSVSYTEVHRITYGNLATHPGYCACCGDDRPHVATEPGRHMCCVCGHEGVRER